MSPHPTGRAKLRATLRRWDSPQGERASTRKERPMGLDASMMSPDGEELQGGNRFRMIHHWLRREVREIDGDDLLEGEYYEFPCASIERLRDTCKQVLDDHGKASVLLPQGRYLYDKHYYDEVRRVCDYLDGIIRRYGNRASISYVASW